MDGLTNFKKLSYFGYLKKSTAILANFSNQFHPSKRYSERYSKCAAPLHFRCRRKLALPAAKVQCYQLSPRSSHSILILILILILIQATQASRWLIFCPPVLLRLLSYGNENDNDKHLRWRTELIINNFESFDYQ